MCQKMLHSDVDENHPVDRRTIPHVVIEGRSVVSLSRASRAFGVFEEVSSSGQRDLIRAAKKGR